MAKFPAFFAEMDRFLFEIRVSVETNMIIKIENDVNLTDDWLFCLILE